MAIITDGLQFSGTSINSITVTNIVTGNTELTGNDSNLVTEAAINNYVTEIINVSGGTNINNPGDNRLLTSDGTSTGINAEANLTWDEAMFTIKPSGDRFFEVHTGITMLGDIDQALAGNYIKMFHDTSPYKFIYYGESEAEVFSIDGTNGKVTIDGELQINTVTAGTTSNVIYYDVTTSGLTYGAATGGGPSYGTDNQIPFMNSAGDDFDYTSKFTFDGDSTLTIAASSGVLAEILLWSGSQYAQMTFNDVSDTFSFLIDGEAIMAGTLNGATGLYYDNSAKISTSSTGVLITGDILFNSTSRTIQGANGGYDLTVIGGEHTTGGSGGDLVLSGGTGNGSNGGDVNIFGGLGSSAGGHVNISAGDIPTTGTGGNLVLNAGDGYGGTDGNIIIGNSVDLPTATPSGNELLFVDTGDSDKLKKVSGGLPVGAGGTGAQTLTNNGVLTGNGTNAITAESNLTFDTTNGLYSSIATSNGKQLTVHSTGSYAGTTYRIDSTDLWTIYADNTTSVSLNCLGFDQGFGTRVFTLNTNSSAKVHGYFVAEDYMRCRDYVEVLDTGGAEGFKMQWNDTDKSVDFIIN